MTNRDGNGNTLDTTTYTYDAAGNRETEVISGIANDTYTRYLYNDQNRLTYITRKQTNNFGQAFEPPSYEYDANGNQLNFLQMPVFLSFLSSETGHLMMQASFGILLYKILNLVNPFARKFSNLSHIANGSSASPKG